MNSGYLSQVERGLMMPSRQWLFRVSTALGRNVAHPCAETITEAALAA